MTIALPQGTFVPVLKEFLEVHRPLLLRQQKLSDGATLVPHRHLILSTKGAPFTGGGFSMFASKQLWKKYTGIPMPPHLLRHIVVTDLGNRAVKESVWQSFAFMVKPYACTNLGLAALQGQFTPVIATWGKLPFGLCQCHTRTPRTSMHASNKLYLHTLISVDNADGSHQRDATQKLLPHDTGGADGWGFGGHAGLD